MNAAISGGSGASAAAGLATLSARSDRSWSSTLTLEPQPFRIEQWLSAHSRVVASTKEVHLNPRAFLGVLGREVAVDNALADRVAVIGARHVTQHAFAVQNWLFAHDDDRWVVDREAAQLAPNSFDADSLEGGPAEKLTLFHPHG